MANYHLFIYPVMQSVVFNSLFRTVLIYKKKIMFVISRVDTGGPW